MNAPTVARDLHSTYANRAYSHGMPARGTAVEIPRWWLDALGAAIAARALKRTDLAEMLIPSHLSGVSHAKALNAARVKVTRFFDHGVHTSEVVDVWCSKLGLPRFEFTAESRQQAEAMMMAQRDPDALVRMMAAGQLMISLESGEHRLDDLIARQTDVVDSPDAPVRRGSRGGGAVSKAAGGQRR